MAEREPPRERLFSRLIEKEGVLSSIQRVSAVRENRPVVLAVGLAIGLAAGLVAGSAVPNSHDLMADEATRQAVAAVKDGIVAGHKARDAEALDRLYADDFTAVDPDGIRTKSDLLAGLAAGPEIVEGQYELSAVRRWGDIAVAKGRGRMVMREADGSDTEVEYESFNVFERRNGRWVYAAAFLP